MKKWIAFLGCLVLLGLSTSASASGFLSVNGEDVTESTMARLYSNTTYVSLRTMSQLLGEDVQVEWTGKTAYVSGSKVSLAAKPGSTSMTVNGAVVPVPYGVLNVQGRVLVPIRTLAAAFGGTVCWSSVDKSVSVYSAAFVEQADYDQEDLYWLSRIISAESKGESLEGQVAVGNVVLNRVDSDEFPDTVYDVIFDDRWGGQFEPVQNGTVYDEPTETSVLAAKLCLLGANTAGDSLYFLAPELAQNFWATRNCAYVTTIGCHDFYV